MIARLILVLLVPAILMIISCLSMAEGTPFFGYSSGSSRSRAKAPQPTRAGRSYNDIARVINPNPYANVGGNPFPAQPFWTYAGR